MNKDHLEKIILEGPVQPYAILAMIVPNEMLQFAKDTCEAHGLVLELRSSKYGATLVNIDYSRKKYI